MYYLSLVMLGAMKAIPMMDAYDLKRPQTELESAHSAFDTLASMFWLAE